MSEAFKKIDERIVARANIDGCLWHPYNMRMYSRRMTGDTYDEKNIDPNKDGLCWLERNLVAINEIVNRTNQLGSPSQWHRQEH